MSSYKISFDWQKTTEDFSYEKFNRNHDISFSGNQSLKTSASADYFGNSEMSNPEELLAASLASCHMLTLLAVASKSGYDVLNYKCDAEAILAKNAEGRMSVTEINLKALIQFSEAKIPTSEQLASLHDKAHKNCFIAQSLKTKVNVL